jgi:AraC-like DNA-binding protein
MGGSVLTVSSRALLNSCDALGIDTAALVAAAGIDRAVIDDPDGHLPGEQVRELWRLAYKASKDPDLALHAAEALGFGAYRVVDYLAASASTIGQSVTAVSAYFPMINSSVRLPITENEAAFSMGIECPDDPAALSLPYVEYTFAAVFLRIREATQVAFPVIDVDFAFPCPASTAEHHRLFECPVRFDADQSRLRISRTTWETPSRRADPILFGVLADHVRILGAKIPTEPAAVRDVRQAILEELGRGNLSLEAVAKRLAMSPRTLQRRLRDHGVSYADLLDRTRASAAKLYLGDSEISVAEVAYLLGFAEQSSFNHAFKRWTGKAPSEYRRGA